MGRTAEVSLYRLFKVGGTHRYVRIVKSGRGWVPKTELVGKPGAYYLRYLKKGSRTFESVGDDIHVALQEQKARQQELDKSTEPTVPAIPPPKTLRERISQFAAKKDGLTKTERRRRAGERRDSECASDGQEIWSTNEGPGPGPNSTNAGGGPKPAADRRKIGGRLRNGSRKAQER